MIDKKLNGERLVGRLCRPVREIRNGAGMIVTRDTVCEIWSVTPGSGFSIVTEKCPCCGMKAYITHVKRHEIELVDG